MESPQDPVDPVDAVVDRVAFRAAVTRWLDDESSRYFVLGGAAGNGKTTALRSLCQTEARITAVHFCDPADLATRNPSNVAQSIAAQLCRSVPGFIDELVAADSGGGPLIHGLAQAGTVEPGGRNIGVDIETLVINAASAEDAWNRVVRRPLNALPNRVSESIVILCDALDEAERYDGLTTLTDLLVGMGVDGIAGVRFLVSTRYSEELVRRLKPRMATVWNLSEGVGREETRAGIRTLLEGGLAFLSSNGMIALGQDVDRLVERATERSDNSFLFAALLLRSLREQATPFTSGDIDAVPRGLDGFLDQYLRQIAGSDPQTPWLGGYESVLSVLGVAREPASEDLLAALSGVAPVVVAHVVRRLGPLLTENGDAPLSVRRYALYHEALRDFLAARDRSVQWWCPPSGGHARILDLYRQRTQDWQVWDGVDDCGLRHLLTHARAAGWDPEQLEAVVSPAFMRAVRDQHGTSGVIRQLEVPIDLAVERGHTRLAFLWCWTAGLLRRGLSEALSGAAPILLVKTGRAVSAVDALGTLDQNSWGFTGVLASTVEALGTESQLDLAAQVIGDAPDALGPLLALRLVLGLARHRPDLAGPSLDQALQRLGVNGLEGELVNVAVAFAQHRGYEQRAWQLVNMIGSGEQKVVRAVAGHDLDRAAYLATHSRSDNAVAWVCQLAAAVKPELAQKLWRQLGRGAEPWWAATIELAKRGLLDASVQADILREYETEPINYALFVAARLAANSCTDAGEAIRVAEELLGEYVALFPEPSDCLIIGDTDLRFVSDLPMIARRLIYTTVSVAIRSSVEGDGGGRFNTDENDTLGRACGSVALCNMDLAVQLLGEIANNPNASRERVRLALVSRLTPHDPDAAWVFARESPSHSIYHAWIEALPASSVALAVSRVAEIDARYSGTRAELAGLLALKLPSGGSAEATQLLHLLVMPLDSEIYLGERRMMTAVKGQTSTGEAEWADEFVEQVARRARHDLAQRLDHELGGPGARRAAGGSEVTLERVEEAARRAAAHSTDVAAALLSHVAADLIRRGIPDIGCRMAEEALHPVYRPVSGSVVRWPRLRLALEVARRHWPTDTPAATFPALIAQFADARHEPFLLLQMLFLLGEVEVPAAADVAVRFDLVLQYNFFVETELIVLSEIRGGLRDVADIERDLPGDIRIIFRVLEQRLIALAERSPDEAVRLVCASDANSTIGSLFDKYRSAQRRLLNSTLSAVAYAHPARAAAECSTVRQWGPDPSVGQNGDSLHGVAFVQSLQSWGAATDLVHSIEDRSVRAMAFADLAAVASRLDSPDERLAAYGTILNDLDPAELGADHILEGLLVALIGEEAPIGPLVSRLLPILLGTGTEREASRIAELASVLGRTVGPECLCRQLAQLERLVTAAWRL